MNNMNKKPSERVKQYNKTYLSMQLFLVPCPTYPENAGKSLQLFRDVANKHASRIENNPLSKR